MARPHLATFRFYAELNDFLGVGQDGRDMTYHFDGTPSVKDAIEAQAVPHTEVDLILANGTSVGFRYRLRHGDRIAVYPAFEALDITPLVRLRDSPLRHCRFVVDVNLGKLARGLRLLGFDTLYRNNFADAEIVGAALDQQRIVLTRDRRLLHHKAITHGYWVRAVDPEQQLTEVVRRFQLEASITAFARCMACNGLVHPVEKRTVAAQLEPKTRRFYDTFVQCEDCEKLYWQGSHFQRLQALVRRVSPPPRRT